MAILSQYCSTQNHSKQIQKNDSRISRLSIQVLDSYSPSHHAVAPISSPREYLRIRSASAELELPSQLTSPVVMPICQEVLVMERPREFRKVKRASEVVMADELSTSARTRTELFL